MFDAPEVLCLGPTLSSGLSLAVVVLIVCRMLLICVLIDLILLMFLIDACCFDADVR